MAPKFCGMGYNRGGCPGMLVHLAHSVGCGVYGYRSTFSPESSSKSSRRIGLGKVDDVDL